MKGQREDISVADNELHFDHGSSAPLPTEAAADEAAAGRFGAVHAEEIYERKIEVRDRAGIRAAQVSTNITSQPVSRSVSRGLVCPPLAETRSGSGMARCPVSKSMKYEQQLQCRQLQCRLRAAR